MVSFSTLPHCRAQWAVMFFTTLPHCRWAVGSGILQCNATALQGEQYHTVHCHIVGGGGGSGDATVAEGLWAVQILQCSATLWRGSRQWRYCSAAPHCSGAVPLRP